MAGPLSSSGKKAAGDVVVEKPQEYASGAVLAALVGSLMLGMFLVALDNVSRPMYILIFRV